MPSAGLWDARLRTAPTRRSSLDAPPTDRGRWHLSAGRHPSPGVLAPLACPSVLAGLTRTEPARAIPSAPRRCASCLGFPGRIQRACLGESWRRRGKGCPLQDSAPGGRWANPDHNRVRSRRVCWLDAQPGLASPATGWGVGHLRWGKSSQGNQLIHSRLKAVRPASRGERIALPGSGWVRPSKRGRRSGSPP